MRVSNRRTNSSSTKTAPAIGALKAVARPAPAPAAISTLQSSQSRPDELADDMRDGRAHLHARPFAPERQPGADRRQPAKELHEQQPRRRRRQLVVAEWPRPAGCRCPKRKARTAGPARRQRRPRRAQPAATIKNPPSSQPCAQTIAASRNRSASASASRKTAPISPDAAPTIGARSARTSRLP